MDLVALYAIAVVAAFLIGWGLRGMTRERRAAGGRVTAARGYWINEGGPETFYPTSDTIQRDPRPDSLTEAAVSNLQRSGYYTDGHIRSILSGDAPSAPYPDITPLRPQPRPPAVPSTGTMSRTVPPQ